MRTGLWFKWAAIASAALVMALLLPAPKAQAITCAPDQWNAVYTGYLVETYGFWDTKYRQGAATSREQCETSAPNYDWGTSGPFGWWPDNFGATWTKTITIPTPGDFRFYTTSDDGIQVTVDGVYVINDWNIHPPTSLSAEYYLTAGTHTIQVRWFEAGGGAVARFGYVPLNRPPSFNAAATNTAQTVAEGAGLQAMQATDPDGDALTYRLVSGALPAGIILRPDGTFSGAASYTSAGSYSAVIGVNDQRSPEVTTSLGVTVNNVDTQPSITPVPNRASVTGAPLNLQIAAADRDGDPLLHSAANLPPGLAINPSTGLISGAIPYGTRGSYDVTVSVTDNTPGSDPALDSTSTGFTWSVSPGDTVAPTISATRTPLPNSAGWNNTDVAVSFSCNDTPSGIASCTGDATVTAEGRNQLVEGVATDVEGNIARLPVLVSLDKTAPTLSGAATAAPNANGWYNGDVTIHWTAADGLSELAADPVDTVIHGEGGEITVTATVQDKAGNQKSAQAPQIKIDRTAPVTTASAPNGWVNQSVTIGLQGSDNLSGVALTSYQVNGGPVQQGTSLPLTDEGIHTVSFWSTDLAGNVEAPRKIEVHIDKTAPSITTTQSPEANSAGWNSTNVTVTFVCTDSLSGITDCTAPQTLTAEGKDQAASGTATDKAGNSASTTRIVHIDFTSPLIAGAPDRAANANGWYNRDVTVSFICRDALSGVAACTAPVTIGEGAGQSVTGVATDAAGLKATETVAGLSVDKTAPTLSGAATTAPNADGWYRTDVRVRWTAGDALSGIAAAPQESVVTGEGDNLSVGATVADLAGNSTPASVSGIRIDRTAPETAAAVPGGWVNQDVKVGLTARDNLSGVKATYAALDGAAAQATNTVPVTAEGVHHVSYWSVDVADNQEAARTATVQIDKTAPVISNSQTPAANAAGWNNADVTVGFTCTDALSGIATCSAPVTVTGEGAGQVIAGQAVDLAGNTAPSSRVISLDKSAPEIRGAVDRQPNSYGWYREDVTVTFTCNDAVSGVADCTQPVVLQEGGDQHVNGNARDRADNTAATAVTGINVDKTAPTLSGAPTTSPNAAGWYRDRVIVRWTSGDALSGIAQEPAETVIVDEGADLATGNLVSDRAGNVTEATVGGLKVDRTPPVTATIAPMGWSTAPVTLTLTANDALSGVKATFYKINGGPVQTGTQVALKNDGIFTVEFWSEDVADNAEEVQAVTVQVDQTPPIAAMNGPWGLDEGAVGSWGIDATDETSGVRSVEWDFGDGSFQPAGALVSHPYPDNGEFAVRVRVTDVAGNVTVTPYTLTVRNLAPEITGATVPTGANLVKTEVVATASFKDAGLLDTHTAQVDWGDGTTSAAVVTETNGSGTLRATHAYTAAGLYYVTITVTDKDGGSSKITPASYVVVYDPNAGKAMGGGWIDSPAGAYVGDPAWTGKAKFGFFAMYRKNATVPMGQVHFQLKAGKQKFKFKSTGYEWLVISGTRAQVMGSGTINGAGNYGFTLTVIDGDEMGRGWNEKAESWEEKDWDEKEFDGDEKGRGGDRKPPANPDKFRIKIWEKATRAVIYDNQMGSLETSDDATVLGRGNAVIRTETRTKK